MHLKDYNIDLEKEIDKNISEIEAKLQKTNKFMFNRRQTRDDKSLSKIFSTI